jgi:hypothetical protein
MTPALPITSEARDLSVKNCDILAAKMTAEQIAEAQCLTRREWEAGHLAMSLTPGIRFGVYEVIAKVGEGDTDEVCQARDTIRRVARVG